MGSGPFRFKEYQAGQSISGVRNPDYYRPGLPYLDGFIGIFADKQAVRVAAIKSDRAAIEFRGFPPATRDELVAALGDKITVQESDWNCGALVTPNHARKPFDDVAGAPRSDPGDRPLAWRGADVADHGHRRRSAASCFPARLWPRPGRNWSRLAGYWPDIEKSRAEARRLLKEAGAEGLTFELLNRNVDQPYKFNGTWVIDEWSKIGVQGNPARGADRTLWRGAAPRRFRCGGDRRRLPEHRQSAARRHQVPAAFGLRRELRELRRPGGNRDLRPDAAGNRFRAAARPDAPVREAGARHRGARDLPALALPHRAVSQLRQRLEVSPSHYVNQDLATIWLDK